MKIRKTDTEKIEALRKRREQLDARLAKLAAKQKSQARKVDARRKIIVGAAVLAHAEKDRFFRSTLRDVLRAAVTRDIDREVVKDLLGDPPAGRSGTPPEHEPLPALRLR